MKRLLPFIAVLLGLAATPHPLGWRSNPSHSKDLKQIQAHPLFRAAPLPAAASVEAGLPKVYDQLFLGSCVANAGAAAFDYQWHQRTGFWVGMMQWGPSRLDLYQNSLRHDGNFPHDWGTYTSSCLWVLKQKGVLAEESWPYNPANLSAHAPTNFTPERRHYAAVSTYDVSNTDHGYSVRQCIANARLPVMIGGYVFDGIFHVTKDNPFIPMPAGKSVGGHEMLAVGYDDKLTHDGHTGMLRVRNSWSESWGDHGYGWLPYDYAFNPHYFEDFGAVETTGPRVVHHRTPTTSPVRGSSEVSSPQRKTFRWPWQKSPKSKSGFIEPKRVFIGQPALLEEIEGKREWRLMRDVVYLTPEGRIVKAKAGLITDLASIPRCVWPIFPPWEPTYGRAALVHDQIYHNHGRMDDYTYTRKEADQVFLAAMKDLGEPFLARSIIYDAVRIANRGWN